MLVVRVEEPAKGDPCLYNHARARLEVNEARIDEIWAYRMGKPDRRKWLVVLTKIHREISNWRTVRLAAVVPMGRA